MKCFATKVRMKVTLRTGTMLKYCTVLSGNIWLQLNYPVIIRCKCKKSRYVKDQVICPDILQSEELVTLDFNLQSLS